MADDHGQSDELHPFGAGSHAPLDNAREMPDCYPIKGNVRDDGTQLYHRPDSRNYGATVPEVWFDSPSAAEAAGFELSPTHPRGSTGDEYEPGRSGHPCTAKQVMDNRNAVPGGAASGAGILTGVPALDAELHPFGVGSRAPLDDAREMPDCYPIKGNVRDDGTQLYHRPDSRNYGATVPEVWFDSPSAAEAAGFELSPTHPRGSTGDEYEPGRSGHPCTVDDVNRTRAAVGGFSIEPLTGAGAAAAAGGAAVVLGADAVDAELHPYGVGSHSLLDDEGEMPACYPIKGNIRNDGSRLYHRPDSRNYGATGAEVWFDSPSAAEAAGFVLAPTHPRRASAADFEPGGSGHPCTVDQVDQNRSASAGLAAAGLGLVGGAAAAASGDADGDDADGDGSGGGRLAAAGAAGAAAVAAGAAALRGRGGDDDDAEAGAAASSGADDVAGPSGDPLAASAARASGGSADADADGEADADAGAGGDADRGDDGDADGGIGLGGAAAGAAAVGAAGAAAAKLSGDAGDAAADAADGAADLAGDAGDAASAGINRLAGAAGGSDGDADADADASGGADDDDDGAGLGGLAAGAAAAGAAGLAAAAAGGDKIGDAVSGAAGKLGDMVSGGADKATDAAAGVSGAAGGAASGAADKAGKAGKAASGAAGKAGEAASGAAGKAGKAASGAAGKAGVAAAGTAGAAGAAASGAAGKVSGTASALRGRARGDDDDDGGGVLGGGNGGFGLSRWLWMALAALALILLLGWLLSRCGDDDETNVAGDDGTEEVDPASPDADGDADADADGDADADADADATTTTTEAEPETTTTEADTSGDLRDAALAALAAAGLSGIDVEVDGDIVRLVGEVASDADVAAAQAALDGLDGVGSLNNEITVAADPAAELQAAAEAALAAAGIEGVEVEVDGDVVRLVGEVDSDAALADAEAALADVEGIGSVANDLVVVAETPPADATDGDPDFTG